MTRSGKALAATYRNFETIRAQVGQRSPANPSIRISKFMPDGEMPRIGSSAYEFQTRHSLIITKFFILFAALLISSIAGTAQTRDAASTPATTNVPSAGQAPADQGPIPFDVTGVKPSRHLAGIDSFSGASRYTKANALLAPLAPGESRVVFFGDSITYGWARDKSFFPGKNYIGRGIGGQTTMQMLIRFRADVIDLHPKIVVILAGTNDIAQNSGAESPKLIQDDLQSMAELAVANHITPILSSILPTNEYPWRKGLQPGTKVIEMNKWIESYCQQNHIVFLNYYPAMVDDTQGMRAELTIDGVHPNPAGYALMAPLAEAAIQKCRVP